MSFDIFKIYHDLAVNTYHVDPKIFIVLMILSVPFYYWGFYKIGKEALKFKELKNKNKKLELKDLFSDKGFSFGLTINRLAWVLPYAYVIFWGENIPLWFWVVFFGWIIFSGYLFYIKIKKMVDVK